MSDHNNTSPPGAQIEGESATIIRAKPKSWANKQADYIRTQLSNLTGYQLHERIGTLQPMPTFDKAVPGKFNIQQYHVTRLQAMLSNVLRAVEDDLSTTPSRLYTHPLISAQRNARKEGDVEKSFSLDDAMEGSGAKTADLIFADINQVTDTPIHDVPISANMTGAYIGTGEKRKPGTLPSTFQTFSHVDFADSSFVGAKLECQDFYNCSFPKTDLRFARMNHTRIRNDELTQSFKGDQLKGVIFMNCDFEHVDFSQARFRNTLFGGQCHFTDCVMPEHIEKLLQDRGHKITHNEPQQTVCETSATLLSVTGRLNKEREDPFLSDREAGNIKKIEEILKKALKADTEGKIHILHKTELMQALEAAVREGAIRPPIERKAPSSASADAEASPQKAPFDITYEQAEKIINQAARLNIIPQELAQTIMAGKTTFYNETVADVLTVTIAHHVAQQHPTLTATDIAVFIEAANVITAEKMREAHKDLREARLVGTKDEITYLYPYDTHMDISSELFRRAQTRPNDDLITAIATSDSTVIDLRDTFSQREAAAKAAREQAGGDELPGR